MLSVTKAAEGEMEAVRGLFRAYGQFLAERGIGVCLSGLDAEIASLPGVHVEPDGVLLLAKLNGDAIGCVALKTRMMPNGERACELKRLYVAPEGRGAGAGRALMQASIDWARERGFAAVVLDTQPEKMADAVRLYQRMGFVRTERFNNNGVPDIEFYRLAL